MTDSAGVGVYQGRFAVMCSPTDARMRRFFPAQFPVTDAANNSPPPCITHRWPLKKSLRTRSTGIDIACAARPQWRMRDIHRIGGQLLDNTCLTSRMCGGTLPTRCIDRFVNNTRAARARQHEKHRCRDVKPLSSLRERFDRSLCKETS